MSEQEANESLYDGVTTDDEEKAAPEPISHLEPKKDGDIEATTVAKEDEDVEYERPEWLPEKFWADDGPNVEALAKSYSELEKKFRSGAHKAPKEYGIQKLEDMGVDRGDPLASNVVEWAKKHGVSEAAWSDLIETYATTMTGAIETQRVNVERERKALGPNADQVIKSTLAWAKTLVRDNAIGDDDFKALVDMTNSAAGIRAMSKIRRYYEGDVVPTTAVPEESRMSKEELYSMVGDPRYESDPAFRAKVEKLFGQYFPDAQ
jgi:hypothetical protein